MREIVLVGELGTTSATPNSSLLSRPARMLGNGVGLSGRLPRCRALADIISIIAIGFQNRHSVMNAAFAVRNGQSRNQFGVHLLQVRRLISIWVWRAGYRDNH